MQREVKETGGPGASPKPKSDLRVTPFLARKATARRGKKEAEVQGFRTGPTAVGQISEVRSTSIRGGNAAVAVAAAAAASRSCSTVTVRVSGLTPKSLLICPRATALLLHAALSVAE